MLRLVSLVRRFPLVALTLAIGLVAGVLALSGLELVVRWVISLYAIAIAAREAVGIVRGVLARQVGLDVLAVTAIVSTVVVGEYWASLIIVVMLTSGEALEVAAAGRAQRELRALLDRVPQRAHRIDVDGSVVDLAADAVRVGDRLLVRPSEIVPVDGEVVSGVGSLDESSLTGESLPVDKAIGDGVLSGSVNGPTAIEVLATAVAADSQYQRIVELVRNASSSKAPLVRLADRYAVPFTGAALAIAGVAWVISGDPVRFAEVLVVATPCPLLIAAPVAFMGGMGSAAKRGIVMKSAASLEKLARVRTVAFDKTGTLTQGRPAVVGVHSQPGFDERTLLHLMGSAEQYSSHVLAASIQQAALDRVDSLSPSTDAREVATFGVDATIDGRRVRVGKPAFVAEHAADLVPQTVESGAAVVYAAVDGRFAGVIVLRDAVRDDAAATLAALRELGAQRIIMVTGDVAATARPIAQGLGITELHAECLPDDKVRIIGDAQPRPVVMVGDGVNDAPVLAVSDVGIAMGAKGSTAASESADVVILLDDIARVARAVAIGRRTVRIALQSIWLGIVISIGLMLVAAVGLLPAVVGATLQEAVDLIAILGALRAVRAGVAPVPGLDAPPRSRRTSTGPVPDAAASLGTGPVSQ